jgi:hypothetical protein
MQMINTIFNTKNKTILKTYRLKQSTIDYIEKYRDTLYTKTGNIFNQTQCVDYLINTAILQELQILAKQKNLFENIDLEKVNPTATPENV